jgi:hypothetical protein
MVALRISNPHQAMLLLDHSSSIGYFQLGTFNLPGEGCSGSSESVHDVERNKLEMISLTLSK